MNSDTGQKSEPTAKRFGLIGAAGYIAPRHMEAIKSTGNLLVAAVDPHDSVGILDRYFPNAKFFVEFERFDRHIDKLYRLNGQRQIEYVSICSPNYLHDAHIRFALRSGADAICEKPIVLNPWNIDGLVNMERDTGHRVNTILQLRLHPSVIALRDRVNSTTNSTKHEVDVTYITSRGKWYLASWKGDDRRSGGIATNIGVHFYDMLNYVFGDLQMNKVHLRTETSASGYLEYEKARVRWFLSLDAQNLPDEVVAQGQSTYRSITVDDVEFEFSGGFGDLHTRSYDEILEGRGFGLEDSRVAIETVANIRTSKTTRRCGDPHPLLVRPQRINGTASMA